MTICVPRLYLIWTTVSNVSIARTLLHESQSQTSPGQVSLSLEPSTEIPPIPYWSAKRHRNPTPGPPWSSKNIAWRGSAQGKLKTANAALVLCLNIDVNPLYIVKINPCAVLEWSTSEGEISAVIFTLYYFCSFTMIIRSVYALSFEDRTSMVLSPSWIQLFTLIGGHSSSGH